MRGVTGAAIILNGKELFAAPVQPLMLWNLLPVVFPMRLNYLSILCRMGTKDDS